MALLFRTELDGEDCVIANVLECVSVLMRPESVISLVRCELLLGLSVPIAMFGTRGDSQRIESIRVRVALANDFLYKCRRIHSKSSSVARKSAVFDGHRREVVIQRHGDVEDGTPHLD